MPHPPQLLLSVCVLTQLPLHSVPLEQAQLPELQNCPAGQALPQPPQLAPSLCGSTQVPAQAGVISGLSSFHGAMP